MKRRQKRKHLENEEPQEAHEKGGGISKTQEDGPQPGPTAMAKVWSPGVGEVSSASEYFSCVSSPCKLCHGRCQRVQKESPQARSPAAQAQEQGEIRAHSQNVSSSHSSYQTCVSSMPLSKEEKGMKIYYMQVQMIKGVAVSWEREETSETLEKQPRMEEAMLLGSVRVGTPPSDVSTRNLLSDSEAGGEEKDYEERADSDSTPGSPVIEERPRAKTPDWLVTMENGFRCMACCRVFATMETLREHVQYGVREGFSCHVFHLTMTHLIENMESESTQEEEEEEEEEYRPEEANEEERPTREDVGLKRSWSQCPGCVFHSPKDRKEKREP
ncbi:protein FAM170A [Perognathus longimembris pacificus]|uniref:protein FAM170A n=1 Tax=Perognathus longimembris pacificus TaxID=214514 RepID=UPI0020190D3E|nr:protein FAM170A [Perognathus longimembris pacificus]